MLDYQSVRVLKEYLAARQFLFGAPTVAAHRAAWAVYREKAAAYGADLRARGFAAPHTL